MSQIFIFVWRIAFHTLYIYIEIVFPTYFYIASKFTYSYKHYTYTQEVV